LHVNISDTSARQFALPPEYFDPPKLTEPSSPERADLQFNYEASPFAFWITRRSDPYSEPIFDTRQTSLPPAPIPAFLRTGNDSILGLDGFPLVFEDRYLQVKYFFFNNPIDHAIVFSWVVAHLRPSVGC
jgi:alpha-glucosidase